MSWQKFEKKLIRLLKKKWQKFCQGNIGGENRDFHLLDFLQIYKLAEYYIILLCHKLILAFSKIIYI